MWGLALFLIGLVISSALFGLTLLASRNILFHALILLTTIPVVVLLIGLLQLVSGVSIGRMAAGWSAASPFLQITLAVLIVLTLLAAIVLIFFLGLESATGP